MPNTCVNHPLEHTGSNYHGSFLRYLSENSISKVEDIRAEHILLIQIPSGRYVQQSSLPAIYTREEIERTLRNGVDRGYPTGKRDYLILLAARLGLRPSDICNLRFENIIWDENTIKRAGVETVNRKHGPHALRHSLAARMLEGQTVLPVI